MNTGTQFNRFEAATQVFAQKNEFATHRDFLKAISKAIKEADSEAKVNDVLLQLYEAEGFKDLATFNEWKRRGFKIKKGSKALPIWSRPIDSLKEERDGTPADEDAQKYFGVCYLFPFSMVEPQTSNGNV